MAIKPQILTELKHGKFICRAVYPTFVATWNWLVRFASTMKGDFDVNPKTGRCRPHERSLQSIQGQWLQLR